MKSKQEIIQNILRFLAERILKKYKPRIIGVTGSVGKSTAKEMIFMVLDKANLRVRKSEKNYNNEIGIPLTIIGAPGERKNLGQWFIVILKSISLILFTTKNYPEILVLELAVDHPGDMKYFCSFIPVDIGVLTNVGISHLENFGNKKDILKEKSYLLKQAKKVAIYNKDNLKDKLSDGNFKQTYGFRAGDFQVVEVGYNYDQKNTVQGMIFKIKYKDKIISGKLNNLLGRPYLYGVLAGLSVAKYFKINLTDALKYLENAPVIPGHMSLLPGIKNTSLIDDTYNSAPASLNEALRVFEKIIAKRKIAVLGDMLELGKEEEVAHREVGRRLAKMKNIIFIAVGNRMKLAVEEFKKQTSDSENKTYWFENSIEAGRFVQDLMREKDLLLIKGSQGMRMEKVVVEIMAEPNKKEKLVVRQNKDWIKK